MKYLNGYIYLSLAIYVVICLLVYLQYPFMFIFFMVLVGLCLLGLLLILAGQIKLGAYLYFIASIGFIPIGALGMVGARKVLDKIEEESFQRRKEKANE